AMAWGLKEIAVFMSATESHNRKNTNQTIAQSLEHFGEIVPAARRAGLTVRAYLSTIWGCPSEGKVDPQRRVQIAPELRAMGCAGISLAATIGGGTQLQTRRVRGVFLKASEPACA